MRIQKGGFEYATGLSFRQGSFYLDRASIFCYSRFVIFYFAVCLFWFRVRSRTITL